jgi:hypothetical protein
VRRAAANPIVHARWVPRENSHRWLADRVVQWEIPDRLRGLHYVVEKSALRPDQVSIVPLWLLRFPSSVQVRDLTHLVRLGLMLVVAVSFVRVPALRGRWDQVP